MKLLTVFEQIILASIMILKDDAFGMAIRKKARQLSGKNIMYGALYNGLDQLYRKGYVTRTKQKSPSDKGGHPRIYYTLTSSGLKALQTAYLIQKSIWAQVPEVTEDP